MRRLFVVPAYLLIFCFHLAAQMGINSAGQGMQCGSANANWINCTISDSTVSPNIAGARNTVPWNWAANNQGEFMNIWIDGSAGVPFPASGFLQAPKVRYDNAVFSMYVPSNVHAGYGNGAALAAYTRTDSTTIAGIGLYGQCLAGADNASYCAGANLVQTDADCKDYDPASCTSHPTGQLFIEGDFSVTNNNTGSAGFVAARPWAVATEKNGFAFEAWRASLPYQPSLGGITFQCNNCTPGVADTGGEINLPGAWSGSPVTGANGPNSRMRFCVKVAAAGTPDTFNWYLDPWSGNWCAGATAAGGPLNMTTTAQFLQAIGTGPADTMAISFAHTTGHNANDRWAWPATGNTPWPYGPSCLDGSCTEGFFVGALHAGQVPNDPSQPITFHYRDASGNDQFPTVSTTPTAGFLFSQVITAPNLKDTGVTSANTVGTDSTGKLVSSLGDPTNVHYVALTATLAQVNSGVTIVPALSGRTLRVINFYTQVAGTWASCADVRLSDTNSTPVDVATIAVAGLTAGNKLTQTSGSVALGAGWLTQLTANQGLLLRQTGTPCTGGASVTVVAMYSINN